MKRPLEKLRKLFKDEEARYAYVDSTTNAFIAAQIKNLREDRKLRQETLAELIGTKQPGVSRFLKSDYSSWKIETLRKLARAFGVRLRISFEEFGSFPPEIEEFTKERLTPRKFADDPVFSEGQQAEPAAEQEEYLTRASGADTEKTPTPLDLQEAATRNTPRPRRDIPIDGIRRKGPDAASSLEAENNRQPRARGL